MSIEFLYQLLVGYEMNTLQIFVYYALSDTRVPALANIPAVGLRIAVDVLIYLMNFCSLHEWSLYKIAQHTFKKVVSKRDWKAMWDPRDLLNPGKIFPDRPSDLPSSRQRRCPE